MNYKNLLVALIIIVAMSACVPVESEPDKELSSLNLLNLSQFAELRGDSGIINLSTEFSDYYLFDGWTNPYELEDQPEVAYIAATARESVLRYHIVNVNDRWLTFTARCKGKHGGPNYQEIEIFVKDQSIGRLEVGKTEKSYDIYIPENLQQRGDNFITFKYSVIEENKNYVEYRPRHSKYPFPYINAYYKDLKIRFGDNKQPLFYEPADEYYSLQKVAEDKYLSQKPQTILSYAFELGSGPEIDFAGSVQSTTGDPETINIRVFATSDNDSVAKELWSKEIVFGDGAAADNFEANSSLAEYANQPVKLDFVIESTELVSQSNLIWRKINLNQEISKAKESVEKKADLSDKNLNVIILVLDAARADHYGSYGADYEATPHMDAFAKDALVFKNSVAAAPYTLTSVASLFTGQYPEGHGLRKISNSLPEDQEKMPNAFTRAGYHTVALVGNQFITPQFGLTKGMDEVIYLRTDDFKSAKVTTMDTEAISKGVKNAADSGKPVFLYCHYLPPHWPYNPPEPWNEFYIQNPKTRYHKAWQVKSLLEEGIIDKDFEDVHTFHRMYLNNLRYGDHLIQFIIDELKTNGLYDNSIVFVISDHGEAFGEKQTFGHSSTVFETMIRVPMIVKVPGIEPKVIDQQVGLVDVYPTLAELLNLDTNNITFQGRSLAGWLSGNEQAGGDVYYARAISAKFVFMARGEKFKYIHDNYKEYLFNLENDPGELINLIDKYPVLAKTLRQKAFIHMAASEKIQSGGEEVELSAEDEEELKNLGYLQ